MLSLTRGQVHKHHGGLVLDLSNRLVEASVDVCLHYGVDFLILDRQHRWHRLCQVSAPAQTVQSQPYRIERVIGGRTMFDCRHWLVEVVVVELMAEVVVVLGRLCVVVVRCVCVVVMGLCVVVMCMCVVVMGVCVVVMGVCVEECGRGVVVDGCGVESVDELEDFADGDHINCWCRCCVHCHRRRHYMYVRCLVQLCNPET